MALRSYKTNRLVWLVASVAVFSATGLLVRFGNTDISASLAGLTLDWIRALLEGEPRSYWPGVAGIVALWLMVALLVGWLLHGLVVIVTSRPESKSPKP